MQDKMIYVRRWEEQIEAMTGIKLPTNLRTYLYEALFGGRAGERIIDLGNDHVEPMIKFIREKGITFRQLGEYMYARHAGERDAAMAKLNPEIHSKDDDNEFGSGMSRNEARRIMSDVQASGKQADYDAAAAMVDVVQENTRKLLRDSGLISKETYFNLKSQYQHYVPLRGFEAGDDASPEIGKTGAGFDLRAAEFKKALGRRSKADNPVLYAILQANNAIVRSEKNRVNKVLLAAVKAHPNPDVWKVFRGKFMTYVDPSTGRKEKIFVPPNGIPDNLRDEIRNGTIPLQTAIHTIARITEADNLFAVKVGGQTKWIQLYDKNLARSMRGAGVEGQSRLIKMILPISRKYAALQTQWNPGFTIPNFLRDLQTALINIGDVEGLPHGVRRQIAREAFSLKAIRGIMAALNSHEGRTIFGTKRAADETWIGTKRTRAAMEYAEWFKEFRLAGGKVSIIEENSIRVVGKKIEKMLKRGNVRGALHAFASIVENINTAVENGVRLSVYIAMRKHGISPERSAFVSRELTTNFSRKGEWGTAINASYIFYNASMQGNVRSIQAFNKSKAVRRATYAFIALGAALDLFNYVVTNDDDDEELKGLTNRWDQLEPWKKERNFIIMLPRGWGEIMIPLPWGLVNIAFVGGQKMSAMGRTAVGHGKTTALDAMGSTISTAADTFNPVGQFGSPGQLIAPTFIDPLVQHYEGKTWYGGPVYPDSKFTPHKPASENYFSSVPWWAKTISKKLHDATRHEGDLGKGYVEVNPEVIEHYFDFVVGGAGRFVNNARKTGVRLVTGDEVPLEQIPIARRFYGKSATSNRGLLNEFYTSWQTIDGAAWHVKNIAGKGLQDEVRLAVEEYKPELGMHKMFRKKRKILSGLRLQREKVKADKGYSWGMKRLELEDIRKKERAQIIRALRAYNRAKEKHERP
jgi:hypothetical protein